MIWRHQLPQGDTNGKIQIDLEQRYSITPFTLVDGNPPGLSMDMEVIGYFQLKTLLQREIIVDKKSHSRVSKYRNIT
jgi:hypothetical protein